MLVHGGFVNANRDTEKLRFGIVIQLFFLEYQVIFQTKGNYWIPN